MKNVGAGELPRGFQWGAVRAGIKASGNLDVAAAIAAAGSVGAAMFTTNQVVAAPVTVGRRHLLATGGRVAAVLVNAGNANCATGEAGIAGCLTTCVAAAETFGCIFDEVVPSSTGIIGVPFPAEKVVAAMRTRGAICNRHSDDRHAAEGGKCGHSGGRGGGAHLGRGEGRWDDPSAAGNGGGGVACGASCDDAGLSVYGCCCGGGGVG